MAPKLNWSRTSLISPRSRQRATTSYSRSNGHEARMRRFIAFAIVLLCSVGMAAQPCADEASWSGFVNCKVKERIDKRIHGDAPRVARDITVKDASKEEKQPSSA